MKRVILLGDGTKIRVREKVKEIRPWLMERSEIVLEDLDGAADLSGWSADLVLVLGGDGSILSAARRMGESPVPVFGVNFGKMGFLTTCGAEEFEREFAEVLDGRMVLHKRMMLVARHFRHGEEIGSSIALNDGVVSRVTLSRMVRVGILVDEEPILSTWGDGLIVATPVGSTAHSLSAGGPIVDPAMEAFVLTPICPHTLTNRPLVLPGTARVRCRLEAGVTVAMLTLDGQVNRELAIGDEVLFERASTRFLLVDTGRRSYFEVLRTKLHWGLAPPLAGEEGLPRESSRR